MKPTMPNRYPIYRDFDQKNPIGWVELNDDTIFTMLDVLSPETLTHQKSEQPELKAFGLIAGRNYLKKPEKVYGDITTLGNKNANIKQIK